MNFSKISEINLVEDDTWKNKTFLTFDIDWAEDFVLEPLIDLLTEQDVKATWFITHDTPLLKRLRGNKNFELGIHPNFNNLLMGDKSQGATHTEIIHKLLDIVPEAVSVRSHSVCQSSRILHSFFEAGLKYDCNDFVSWKSSIQLKPWNYLEKLIKVPYFWSDEISSLENDSFKLNQVLKNDGLKVYDFHPIHVYLNTEKISRYEKSRQVHRDVQKLPSWKYNGSSSTASFLQEIIQS
ncbi:MAG: hypothetical protein NE334_17865 [Lentisphaeraceae bacterium]|nr:hypothetical protein [Lentisphaeraceae bacterium]